MKHRSALVLLVFAISSWTATDLRAWDYGMPWFGHGYSGSLYGLGYVPVPPYFALHPPVQYSRPVAYPYGGTPYAVRPHELRVKVETPAPRMIVNPFVSTGDTAAIAAEAPKMIINPYYQPSQAEPAEEVEGKPVAAENTP